MTLFLALALCASLQESAADLPKKHLAPKPKPAAVLAKVGGVPIRASDLESYLWDWRAYEVVQDAVTYQVVALEAKRLKVSIPEVEVQAEVEKQLALVKGQLKKGQSLNQALQEQGFSKSRLYLRIRSDLLLSRIAGRGFDAKAFVKVSTIVIRPRSEQANDIADALRRAEDAYTALKDGEKWEDVLARHSDTQSVLQSGGLLGWRELSAFPPTVRQELGTLKPGQFTKPALTTSVVQIFRLEALGSSAVGPALKELKEAYVSGARPKVLEDIRKRTPVEIFLGK